MHGYHSSVKCQHFCRIIFIKYDSLETCGNVTEADIVGYVSGISEDTRELTDALKVTRKVMEQNLELLTILNLT